MGQMPYNYYVRRLARQDLYPYGWGSSLLDRLQESSKKRVPLLLT